MGHRPYPNRERALRRLSTRAEATPPRPRRRVTTERDPAEQPYEVDSYRISTR